MLVLLDLRLFVVFYNDHGSTLNSGILFLADAPMVIIADDDQPNVNQTIQKFDLSKRKVDKFLEEVNDYVVSFDGDKILYRKGEQWATASTDEAPSGGGPPKP